jgi:hypothetical protein
MEDKIIREINTDRAINIANALLSQINGVMDSEVFPESFTHAEFAIGSILMAREVQRMYTSSTIPADFYMDELSESYLEFIRLITEEVGDEE